MELVIQIATSNTPPPRADDFVITPKRERRCCALDVLAHGLQGRTISRVVLQTPGIPTLDDMLAGSFAVWLARGEKLGPMAEAFARYAALARSGYSPSRCPLEVSLEGIFAALTWRFGGKLVDAGAATDFVAAWERMAEVIHQAIEKNVDPFCTALFSESMRGGAFAEEIVGLRADKKVYEQDVKNGRRYRIHLGEGKGVENSALYLREPKALLFKQWARSDVTSPSLDGYLMLIVRVGSEWVFSTDPAQKISLAGLAEKLTEAAGRKRLGELWFDGAVFNYSLIGAPRGGTKLLEAEVMGVFEKFARAKLLVKPRGEGSWVPLALAAGMIVVLGMLGYWSFHTGAAVPLDPTAGATELDEMRTMPLASRGGGEGSANLGLFIGINRFRQDQFPPLSFAVDDAIAQAHLFSLELKLMPAENVTLALEGEPGSMRDVRMLAELKAAGATVTGADSSDILDDLERLNVLSRVVTNRSGAEDNRLVLVSVSTHGIEIEGTPYIVPHNIALSDLGRTAVAVKELTDRMGACHASKRLLVIDACRTSAKAVAKGSAETMPADFLTMLANAKGEGTLASCSTGQSSYELRDKGHGLFTYWLLLALKGSAPADGSGFITVGSLEGYLSEKVTHYSVMNAPSKQEPFFMLTEEARGIPLGILPR